MSSSSPADTRDEDVPAVAIELADGNAWGLALPGRRIHSVTRRERDPFGRPRVLVELVTRTSDYPLEVWQLWDSVRAASTDNEFQFHDALRCLAVAMLRMAHEIEHEEAEALVDLTRVDIERVAETIIPIAFSNASAGRPDER